MASSSFSSRIGSLPAKFAWPLFLSFPPGGPPAGNDEESNSPEPRRGSAPASVARDIAANSPAPTISAHLLMGQPTDCRQSCLAFESVSPYSISYAQSLQFSTLHRLKSCVRVCARVQCGLDFSVPSFFSVTSVLKLLTLVFP